MRFQVRYLKGGTRFNRSSYADCYINQRRYHWCLPTPLQLPWSKFVFCRSILLITTVIGALQFCPSSSPLRERLGKKLAEAPAAANLKRVTWKSRHERPRALVYVPPPRRTKSGRWSSPFMGMAAVQSFLPASLRCILVARSGLYLSTRNTNGCSGDRSAGGQNPAGRNTWATKRIVICNSLTRCSRERFRIIKLMSSGST